jgi:N-acetylglucosamine-6-phosphate deacetylase
MYNTGIYTSSKLFTGSEWLYNYAVVVNDGMIENLLPNNKLLVPATKHLNCLIPAFIDIQIYGAYEQLFSVFLQQLL